MKAKFVNVYDEGEYGRVPFIILEVEEQDMFLKKAGFSKGYKFLVQAINHRVGGAGGLFFNPYYGERTREMSKKIDTTEADVLGFYLKSVKDIYDIPEELYTENFWNVVRTDHYGKRDDVDYELKNCYKALVGFNENISKWIIIDKDSLEIVYSLSSTDKNRMIADYLWKPCDVLPLELWAEVQKENEEISFYNIIGLNE